MALTTKFVSAEAPLAVEEAALVLRGGGLAAFPTDTVYGLGVHLYQLEAVRRIFAVKGRGTSKAVPVLLGQADDVARVAHQIPPITCKLAEAFWPGGLTLVLVKAPDVPDVVAGGGPTVAVRVPNHPVALRLIREVGAPLATTSANRSGRPSPKTAQEVCGELEGLIDFILDGGRVPGGVESTVLDLTTTPATVRRSGAVSIAELERVLGERPVVA